MIYLKYKDCLKTYTKTCCMQILCQVSNLNLFNYKVLTLVILEKKLIFC